MQDVQNLTFKDETFERIIVSCVLAHVDNPYKALCELRRVLRTSNSEFKYNQKKKSTSGLLTLFISADPSIVRRSIRRVTSQKKIQVPDMPFGVLNALSHRNSAGSLIKLIDWVFADDVVKKTYYPSKIPSWNLATHIIVNVVKLS